MRHYYLTDDPDKNILSGFSSTAIVQRLKEPWHMEKTNLQYMKDFKSRAITIYGEQCDRIRVNSCKNFIEDLIQLSILTPVNPQTKMQ